MSSLKKSDGYDIDMDGVSRVLKSLRSPADDMSASMRSFQRGQASVADSIKSSTVVTALNKFGEMQGPELLLKVVGRSRGCITNTSGAAKAYADGDAEMLRQAQRNMAVSPGSFGTPLLPPHRDPLLGRDPDRK